MLDTCIKRKRWRNSYEYKNANTILDVIINVAFVASSYKDVMNSKSTHTQKWAL